MVEVVTFDGCPHGAAAIELAERVVRETGVDAELRRVDVPDDESAARERFLGSPTIRVDGRDVEPGAEGRTRFARSCRLYMTSEGLVAQPDERWLRDALLDR